ncbi:hypothetical protein GN244_ATG00229 [Phytophthora infestans]|uniref:Uncharacterized protein n=1 Tax=Phytophthora infestans TaxID=4787 RepID=A0A833TUR1_PHYIN|nr:hypothetical protein GN244_ATG00229 [Phytophthora infestans]
MRLRTTLWALDRRPVFLLGTPSWKALIKVERAIVFPPQRAAALESNQLCRHFAVRIRRDYQKVIATWSFRDLMQVKSTLRAMV